MTTDRWAEEWKRVARARAGLVERVTLRAQRYIALLDEALEPADDLELLGNA